MTPQSTLAPASAQPVVRKPKPLVPTAISADLLEPPAPGIGVQIRVLVFLVVAFVVWATFAPIEEVTTGRGRVIPASKIQLVQNLEGGIVREISVREGQRVVEGELLLRIDPTIAGASLGEAREKLLGLEALMARLEAEVDDRPLVFPADVATKRPDVVAHQRDLFETRRRELRSALSVLELQELQRAQEVLELEAKIATLKRALGFAKDELDLIRPLQLAKAAARSELLTAEAKFNDTQGGLRAAELAMPRVQAAVREARDKREERISAFRSDALQKLASARIELSALTEQSRSSEDKVARTTIKAPTTGIVKTVHVTTPGQVVQPGHSLVEIVPLNDKLLVEAQVRPQDIAFLRPGQRAVVKVTAYDFALYGGLEGVVDQIGADSITSEKGETYYLIRVRTEKSQIQRGSETMPIIPGMVADVDVLTGSKTILAYLMKPLTRMRSNALRER